MVFICFLVSESLLSMSFSTSFFLMNSRGWKSLSILSIIRISSCFTNLFISERRLFEIFFTLSKSSLMS